MKKTVLETAFAVVIVVLAFALVTCQPEVPEGGDGGDGGGYTDVVYEYTGSSGDVRVKSVKIYLDGTVVPRTAAARKLDLEAARMGHDFFEVVFWSNRTGDPSAVITVARASWEIGQQAGISGVYKNSPNGVDYTALTPRTGTATAANVGSSAIFVGKKSSKTLLGVGFLSHINDGLIDGDPVGDNLITDATNSVTFTVSPLQTWLGFVPPSAAAPIVAENTVITKTIRGDQGGVATVGDVATFITAAGNTTITGTNHLDYGSASSTPGVTKGSNRTLRTGAVYPQFDLPSVANLDSIVEDVTIKAVYTVGGLDLSGGTAPNNKDLRTAVRTWGHITGTMQVTGGSDVTGTGTTVTPVVPTDNARGGLQFIKRTPAFLYQGTTYGLPNNDDKVTKITLDAETRSDQPFDDTMELTITQYRRSGGVFGITFQQPVYLLTVRTSTNNGPPKAEKWWIRPDYGQYQYLLDNGQDSGGMVLLATDLAGGTEWIEIKTTGIGFDNE
jgi:hypothetical protein